MIMIDDVKKIREAAERLCVLKELMDDLDQSKDDPSVSDNVLRQKCFLVHDNVNWLRSNIGGADEYMVVMANSIGIREVSELRSYIGKASLKSNDAMKKLKEKNQENIDDDLHLSTEKKYSRCGLVYFLVNALNVMMDEIPEIQENLIIFEQLNSFALELIDIGKPAYEAISAEFGISSPEEIEMQIKGLQKYSVSAIERITKPSEE